MVMFLRDLLIATRRMTDYCHDGVADRIPQEVPMALQGKQALLTGSAREIGRGIAHGPGVFPGHAACLRLCRHVSGALYAPLVLWGQAQ